MRRQIVLPSLVAILVLGGCSTTLKRHEAVTTAAATSNLVDVRLFATTPPSEARVVRGLDLAPDAQAVLADAMLELGWTSDEIITELGRQQTSRDYGRRSEPLRRKIRLVMTVSMAPAWAADPANVADRVEDIQVTLTPTNAERFISWEQQATAYGTVNLGSQTDTASFTLGAEAGVDVSGSLDALTLSPSYTRSRANTQTLATRYVASNVHVTDGALTFSQASAPNQDLVGNIVVDATLNLPAELSDTVIAWRTSELVEARGAWADPSRVNLRPTQITVAKSPARFCMRMRVDYRVRHVTKPDAASSVSESDDTVQRLTGSTTQIIPLAGADLSSLWSVRTQEGVSVSAQGKLVGSRPVTLEFESAAAAGSFRDWLVATGASSTRDFVLVDDSGNPLSTAVYRTLQIYERPLGSGVAGACPAS